MTRKLVFNEPTGFVNGDFDDDDDFDADGEIVDNGEFEMMLGVPSINFAEEVAHKRKDARFDRQIDGPKPKVTRRRHSTGDNLEDDDEVARPLSMNGEELLGIPTPDWNSISRGEPDIVTNDGGEDMLGVPVPNWADIAKRQR